MTELNNNKDKDNGEKKPLIKTNTVSQSISTALLLPASVIFLAVALSSSLIISASILSKSIKDSGGIVNANNTAATTTTPVQATQAPTVTLDQVKGLFTNGNMTFGDANRKVLFVEFSDPSCPYCHIAGGKNSALNKSAGSQFTLVADGGTYVAPVEEMHKLVNEGKASFVWIYQNGHGNGEMGTRALYCSYDKGKFWETHDLLMSADGFNLLNGKDANDKNAIRNDKAKSGQLAEFLKTAIDPTYMKSCLDSGKFDNRISQDQSLAATFGVTGTPGFFINNTSYAGAFSYKDMKATVDAALNS